MRIGYAKLGRSFTLTLNKSSGTGGDIEVVNLLNHLRQEHEVHLIGPNRHDARLENCVQYWGPGDPFYGLPIVGDANRTPSDPVFVKFMDQIVRATESLPDLDAYVIWLGQHGTSASFLPRVISEQWNKQRDADDELKGLTAPLMSLINYVYPVVHIINHHVTKHGKKVIWLCPDPRNKLKARDITDHQQEPILAQYVDERENTFWGKKEGFRYNKVTYEYSGIELLAVDRDQLDVDKFEINQRKPRPLPLGILVNEGYNNIGKHRRLVYIQDWFRGREFEIFGNWCKDSQRTLRRAITMVPLSDVTKTVQRWRATMTFPASGTGWATAKPWESFAAGTICFRHPLYDDQNHIYGEHMNSELRDFLSPRDPGQLRQRLDALEQDELYHNMAKRQFDYLMHSVERLDYGTIKVKERIKHAHERGQTQVLRGEEEVVPVRGVDERGHDAQAGAAQG